VGKKYIEMEDYYDHYEEKLLELDREREERKDKLMKEIDFKKKIGDDKTNEKEVEEIKEEE
jgi:hypothetical protein